MIKLWQKFKEWRIIRQSVKFAKELKKLVVLTETRPHQERCWRFPPLEECRNDFEEKYGIKITEPG